MTDHQHAVLCQEINSVKVVMEEVQGLLEERLPPPKLDDGAETRLLYQMMHGRGDAHLAQSFGLTGHTIRHYRRGWKEDGKLVEGSGQRERNGAIR